MRYLIILSMLLLTGCCCGNLGTTLYENGVTVSLKEASPEANEGWTLCTAVCPADQAGPFLRERTCVEGCTKEWLQ